MAVVLNEPAVKSGEKPRIRDQVEVYKDQLALLQELTADSFALQVKGSISPVSETIDNFVKSIIGKVATHQRILQVLQAGYGEITLDKEGWLAGEVDDPRPFKSDNKVTLWTMGICAPIIALLLNWFLNYGRGYDLFIAISSALLGLLASGLLSLFAISWTATKNIPALEKQGLERMGTYHFFKGTLPEPVRERYNQARESGLFDRVQIYAPKKVFHQFVRVDPFIIGTIGENWWHPDSKKHFLIVAFDLSKDLEQS